MKKDPNKQQDDYYAKFVPMDQEEEELHDFLETGEYISNPRYKEDMFILKEAAKAYKELENKKKITLRLKNIDLIQIKAKAEEVGIPYQRIIQTLVHQYANGKITITL